MGIRSTAKALIVKDGKLLVIRCQRGGKEYCTLPGGGQEYQESLEQTVVRECLEEAGLSVRVNGLAAVQEEIITNPSSIEQAPEYCHEHLWYFRCEMADEQVREASHGDLGQIGPQWVPLDQMRELPILPEWLKEQAKTVLCSVDTVFLGTVFREKSVIPGD